MIWKSVLYPYFNLHLRLFLFESLQLTQKTNQSIFSQYAIIPIFKNSALILFVPYFFSPIFIDR